jgi:membrane protease YdiL (CAAX protease family)
MPAGARQWAQSVARLGGFVVLFLFCTIAADGLLTTPLRRFIALFWRDARIDVLVMLIAAIASTAIMLRAVDSRDWAAIGLSRDRARPPALVAGLIAGLGAIVLVTGLLLAGGWLIFGASSTTGSWSAAALRVTMVLLPAALAEELLCRGYLLTVTRDVVGVRGAIIATSVLFGVLHLGNPGATAESVVVVTISGIFLATVRVALDSLYAAWMAHFAWNWVMAVPLHAAVSGVRFESPGYRATSVGPEWISGGTWGPEGGIIAAAGMLGGLAFFYARHRREES